MWRTGAVASGFGRQRLLRISDAHVCSHAHACRQASLRYSCTHKHTRASTRAHKAPGHHFGARPWPLFSARWPGSCRACDAHTSHRYHAHAHARAPARPPAQAHTYTHTHRTTDCHPDSPTYARFELNRLDIQSNPLSAAPSPCQRFERKLRELAAGGVRSAIARSNALPSQSVNARGTFCSEVRLQGETHSRY